MCASPILMAESLPLRIKFVIPLKPFSKQRPRHNTHTGATYTPEETTDYEDVIKLAYKAQCKGFRFADDVPIAIRVLAVFPIPKNTSKKKREQMLSGEILPIIRPDTDNLLKIVQDALNNVAYKDDSHIVKSMIDKEYGETPQMYVIMEDARLLRKSKENG